MEATNQSPPVQKDPSPSTGALSIFAAGLNIHTHLLPNKDNNKNVDLRTFIQINSPDSSLPGNTTILFTHWSSTIFITLTHLIGQGHQAFTQPLSPDLDGVTLHSAFGDHNGLQGCLDTEGNLHVFSWSNMRLEKISTESSPSIGLIVLAMNDKVCITFKQAPNGHLCHVLQFASVGDFLSWFADPSGVKIDHETQHFEMQGRPSQLVAQNGVFACLMEGGEVWTWGDARFRSLGRSIKDSPAGRPAQVEALGGLKIVEIACGGWMGVALSEDRAAYIWGAGQPGWKGKTIRLLREAEAGEAVLVEIPSETGEPLDILDIGAGDNNVAVLTEGGRLFVVGENTNGQLGIGSHEQWNDDWTEVTSLKNIRKVICGPKVTFAFTAESSPS